MIGEGDTLNRMQESYVSMVVETDGLAHRPRPMPGVGCAAYIWDKTLASPFSANLKLLPVAAD